MFQHYHNRIQAYDSVKICIRITITDTEFVEEYNLFVTRHVWALQPAVCDLIRAVIKVYSERNLNVAANLALAIKWNAACPVWPYTGWLVREAMIAAKTHVSEFAQYEADVMKYLTLV